MRISITKNEDFNNYKCEYQEPTQYVTQIVWKQLESYSYIRVTEIHIQRENQPLAMLPVRGAAPLGRVI